MPIAYHLGCPCCLCCPIRILTLNFYQLGLHLRSTTLTWLTCRLRVWTLWILGQNLFHILTWTAKKNTVKYGKTEILFMNSPCIHPAPLVAWQSLQDGFCAFCLGRALDKTEQCSRWDLRPFSEQQLKYAALDAWILLALLGHIIKKACWNNLKEECDDIVWLLRLLSYFLKFDEFCNLSLHLFQVWTNNHFFKSWHSSFQPTVH